MAKIKYGTRLGDDGVLSDFYTVDNLQLDPDSGARRGLYVDTETNNTLVLIGNGLKYGDNLVTGGVITAVNFRDDHGKSFVSLTDGHYTAQQFSDAFSTGGLDAMLKLALKGKDTIGGSINADNIFAGGQNDIVRGGGDADNIDGGSGKDKLFGDAGNDFIFGGGGNDRMTGGAQRDTFHFQKGTGDDVITDFDVTGNNHDFVHLFKSEHFTEHQHGKNLVLDFGDGDTLTLLNVDKDDFGKADIVYAM